MDKVRFYIYVLFTYIVNFGLIYYISNTNSYTAASVTLTFGCILVALSLVKDLHPAREMFFSVISVLAIGVAAWKLTSPYVCGASGIFTALLYIYLMYKFIWTGPVKIATDENQKRKDSSETTK